MPYTSKNQALDALASALIENGIAFTTREDIPRVPVILVPGRGFTLVIDPDDEDPVWTWLAVAWSVDLAGPLDDGDDDLAYYADGQDQLADLVWWIVSLVR